MDASDRPPSPHPPAEQLRDFVQGRATAEAIAAIEAHLVGCPSCCDALDELPADGLESLIRAVGCSTQQGAAAADTDANSSPLPDVVAGRPRVPGYEVLGELGRGGMGVVYKARQVGLGRTVALKMLLAGAHADVAQVARFRAEGEAVGRLRHPNVVQVYDCGTSDGLPYFALEYVEGGSLADHLGGTPQPPGEAAAFVEMLARAMAAAHREGIIHRDLKPANVLLAREPNGEAGPGLAGYVPKITDFGLAKWAEQMDGLTRTGTLVGTPAYMAPEQAAGDQKRVGPTTDVYALGAVLYDLLTGRPPFQGSTSLETLDQVRHAEPVPPGRLAQGLPRDLETICLKCLEKEPARRYQSAAELADDLARFRRGEPIFARPVGALGRACKWARRRPSLAVLLALTAAALVGGTGVSAYFGVEAGRRAWDAERALDAAQEARRQSDLRSAELLFRAGLEQCQSGAVDRGLFTMLEAWRSAPEDAVAFRRVVRTSLAAWSRQLPILEQMLQHPQKRYALTRFAGPDGKTLVTWAIPHGRHVVRWDPATGQPLGPPFVGPAGEQVVDVNPAGTLVSTNAADTSFVRELSTGRLVGSEFKHRRPDEPALQAVALFCGPGDVLVTKCLADGDPQRLRRLWRLPAPGGQVQPLLTLRLAPGDGYHVTSAGGKEVAVVFRQSAAVAGSTLPQAEYWDLTTGARLPALPVSTGRNDPRVSWDGRTILSVDGPEVWGGPTGGVGAVRCWDATTGGTLGEPWRSRRPARYATLSADGQLLAVRGEDHRVRLFDPVRGLQRGGDVLTTGFRGVANEARVSVSPDATRVAAGATDGVVRLWRTAHFLPLTTRAANPREPGVTLPGQLFETGRLSPNGRTGLVGVTAESGVGRLVPASGEGASAPLRQRHLHHCAFSPDSAVVATAPDNHHFGGKTVVTLWETSGRPRVTLNQYRFIHSLAFSQDGGMLAVGCVGGTLLWDVPTARVRHLLREPSTARDLAFSPDGTRLAVAYISGWPGVGSGVRLWDATTGRPVGEFLAEPHPPRLRPFFVLAFADGGQTLHVFDLATGKLHALDARTGAARHAPLMLAPAEGAAFSPDGSVLATSHANGSVQQWDPTTGKRAGALIELPHPVARLCSSPDGRVLAIACRDLSVRLWDAASCGPPLGPPLLHRADVLDLRFKPEGDSLVTLTATGRMHTWPLPKPVADDPEQVELWLQATGGVGLVNNAVALLEPEAWRRCRERLRERWPEADPALHRPADEADWHDARAHDAEEDGNTFAALWHLDRLIALRLRDWQPHALKGLLYAKAGDLDLAESAYRLAAKHAPAAALQDWHRQNAATYLIQKQWGAALRHLDWLAAAGGEDWQAHADRATAFGHLDRPRERETARARAVETGADSTFLVPLAEEKAAQGQWPEAAALFTCAAERGGLDVPDECHHALTCLKAGDAAGYRRICARLVHDLATDGPMTAAFRRGSVSNILSLFRACLLRADAVTDWQPLLKLSEEILAVPMRELALAEENQLVHLRQDCLAARGAVLCRQGRYQEAIDCLRQGVSQERKAGNDAALVFLTFAHLRLGQKVEARQWLDAALPPKAEANFSWAALEVELLRPTVVELQKETGAPGK